MKRRNFVQLTLGSTLATLGLSQFQIEKKGLQYAKAIAQNTPRKLALLVGINNYEKYPLSGCITDVYLQKELLIHRYGFNPQDILIVSDDSEIKPTRNGILQAFEEHLIKQAKPEDVVVFHYSGHGSRIVDINNSGKKNSTLVPLDRQINNVGGQRTVSDIMGKTLFLLMSALPTENVTVVLDSCHSGGGKRGNLKIRSITELGDYPSNEEFAYQQQWLTRLQMSPDQFESKRQQGVAKGVVIASAGEKQYAADAPFNGFYAGAFSYVMTQYLWQEASNQNMGNVITTLATNTTAISSSKQVPEYEYKGNSPQQPVYFLNKQVPPAEAVVTEIQGNEVELWLGGIAPQSFAAFNQGARFALINKQGKVQGLVELTDRNGVKGRGKIVKSDGQVQRGLLLQEQARIIADDFRLKIGLDDSLKGENTTNLKNLVGIERLEFLPLGQGEVHYIFGKMTPELSQELSQNQTENIPAVGSFGLYGQGLDLIPDSFGNSGENLTDALTRLKTKLRSLLAARLIKLTLNSDSSKLNVLATMKLKNGELVAKNFTVRGGINATDNKAPEALFSGLIKNGNSNIPQVKVNSLIEFNITNNEKQDLFVTVIVIDSDGTINIIFPNTLTDNNNSVVKSGETRIIPDGNKGDQFSLRIGPPLGIVEVLIIASVSPLTDALKTLQGIASRGGQRGGTPVTLKDNDSTETVDNLLKDVDQGSRGIYAQYNPNSRSLDTSLLAAMSITFSINN